MLNAECWMLDVGCWIVDGKGKSNNKYINSLSLHRAELYLQVN